MDKESLEQALALAQERRTSLEATVQSLAIAKTNLLELLVAAKAAVREVDARDIVLPVGDLVHPRFRLGNNTGVELDNAMVAREVHKALLKEGRV